MPKLINDLTYEMMQFFSNVIGIIIISSGQARPSGLGTSRVIFSSEFLVIKSCPKRQLMLKRTNYHGASIFYAGMRQFIILSIKISIT